MPGANLVFTTIVFLVLIAFLGLVTATGLNAFLGESLHAATSTAALAGAASLFDGSTEGPPVLSPVQAEEAARRVFVRHVEGTPALASYNAQLVAVTPDVDRRTMTVEARANVTLPFLGVLGINTLELNSTYTARHAIYVPEGMPLQLGTTSTWLCGGEGNPDAVIDLDYPLTDRPGPDLQIDSTNKRGYVVLGCSGEKCWDLGGAAILTSDEGGVRNARLPGSTDPVRVIYGSVYIDLGAESSLYTAPVRKISRLLILDDQVPDTLVFGQRFLELCPQNGARIDRIQIFHQAHACVGGGTFCLAPTGLQPLPG